MAPTPKIRRALPETFPPEIRKIVYTTNAVESLNARFRQANRRRGHFPNEQATLKVLYLVIRTPQNNRTNITGRTPRVEGRPEHADDVLR